MSSIKPGSRSEKARKERFLTEVLLRGDPSAWLGFDPGPIEAGEMMAALRSALPQRGKGAAVQLYLHFAFCKMSCRFCQYWHVLSRDDSELELYTDHLISLLRRYREALGKIRVSNGYFGGGTPTALSTPMLRRLLRELGQTFEVAHELTTEAHPETLSDDKLEILAQGGINRLSMGVQSFDEGVLHRVGRSNGPPARLRLLVRKARELGMWVNLDLIAGLPSQSPLSFREDLERTLDLAADTITIYRYQPVHRLPDEPAREMALGELVRPRLLRIARAGYAPFSPIRNNRYSVLLVRASGRALRYIADNVAPALSALVGPSEIRRYTDLDRDDVFLVGLGPGAVSHVQGVGWLRDVTSVRAARGDAPPLYWGTRLTAEMEHRSRALLRLGAGDWLDTRLFSSPEASRVQEIIESAERRGQLRRMLFWVSFPRAAKPADRAAVLTELLPDRPPDADRANRALAFKMRKDVQPELVDIDRAHREAL